MSDLTVLHSPLASCLADAEKDIKACSMGRCAPHAASVHTRTISPLGIAQRVHPALRQPPPQVPRFPTACACWAHSGQARATASTVPLASTRIPSVHRFAPLARRIPARGAPGRQRSRLASAKRGTQTRGIRRRPASLAHLEHMRMARVSASRVLLERLAEQAARRASALLAVLGLVSAPARAVLDTT
jgi:hypothetical protein